MAGAPRSRTPRHPVLGRLRERAIERAPQRREREDMSTRLSLPRWRGTADICSETQNPSMWSTPSWSRPSASKPVGGFERLARIVVDDLRCDDLLDREM
jgi:hypothetical protein